MDIRQATLPVNYYDGTRHPINYIYIVTGYPSVLYGRQRIFFFYVWNPTSAQLRFPTIPQSFQYKNFPAVSGIDLFNLGSFPFFTELYHNISAETLPSIQLDRSGRRWFFLCVNLLEKCFFMGCRLQALGCCML